jgi:hypothetical protein
MASRRLRAEKRLASTLKGDRGEGMVTGVGHQGPPLIVNQEINGEEGLFLLAVPVAPVGEFAFKVVFCFCMASSGEGGDERKVSCHGPLPDSIG